jgi:hypothetical protein
VLYSVNEWHTEQSEKNDIDRVLRIIEVKCGQDIIEFNEED